MPKQTDKASRLKAFLTAKGSPLAKHATQIVDAGDRYGVDPNLIVAIAGAETAYGTSSGTGKDVSEGHNAWGWGPHIKFSDWGDAIYTVASGLRRGYLDEGLQTVEQIGAKWAPAKAANDPTGLNNNWSRNVRTALTELTGGDSLTTMTPTASTKPVKLLPPLEPQAVPEPPPGDLFRQTKRGLAQSTLDMIAGGEFDPVGDLSRTTRALLSDTPDSGGQVALESLEPLNLGSGTPNHSRAPEALPRTASRAAQKGHLAEAFYDPIGQWDNGTFSSKGIGGHSDHVHLSITNPQAMLSAVRKAQALGLSARENPFTDPVDPVHVQGSYHYRNFQGKTEGRTLGMGLDVSGPAPNMAAFFQWALDELS